MAKRRGDTSVEWATGENIELRPDPVRDSGKRLDVYISEVLAGNAELGSRSRVSELITSGFVLVNGRPEKKSYRLEGGEKISVTLAVKKRYEFEPVDLGIELLHEEEDFAVLNKPAGVTVHSSGGSSEPTVMNDVLHKFGLDTKKFGARPGIVHRLDRWTSGLLLVAKTPLGQARLSELFRERLVIKRYLAIATGRIKDDERVIEKPISRAPSASGKMYIDPTGRHAKTSFRVIDRSPSATLLNVRIHTGRTHQIRVHLASIGNPILGDELYGKKSNLIGRQALHAYYLAFDYMGREFEFSVRPPEDFMEALKSLGMNFDDEK